MIIRTPTASSTMTALAPPATSAAAPWRAQFLQQLSKMPMPLCAVSTIHPTGDSGSASTPTTRPSAFPTIATPRVRFCVCRGLWGTLPENAKNPAPRNPALYESDLPVFTTDARMAKAWELAASAPSGDSSAAELGKASTNMTGGGGPVEAVWWASESGTQWRIRGTAWVLGPDIEEPSGEAARSAIEKYMRQAASSAESKDKTKSDWSWPREITAHFGNMSPGMRGSFRNPAPGRPRPRRGEEGNTQPGEGMGTPVGNDHLEDPAARSNFRVVVIVPDEVDQVDLSKGDDPRRWVYTYVGEDWQDKTSRGLGEGVEIINGWAKQEVWP